MRCIFHCNNLHVFLAVSCPERPSQGLLKLDVCEPKDIIWLREKVKGSQVIVGVDHIARRKAMGQR